jgi:hypothetical protein
MLVHMSVSATTQKFLRILAADNLYENFPNKSDFGPH